MKGFPRSILFLLGAIFAAEGLNPTPSITEPSQTKSHYIEEDSTVTLKCQATGEGVKTYKWYRDNAKIESDKDIFFDSESGDLKIIKYGSRYNGEYQCKATIGEATTMSRIQTLYRIKLPRFKDADPTYKTVKEHEYAMLECANQGDVVGSPEDISYKWYISRDTRELMLDGGRLFIDYKGNLHFTFVKEDDATGSDKQYRCGYSSVTLKSIFLGNDNNMVVEKTQGDRAINAVVMATNDPVQVFVGENAKLECIVSGFDPRTSDNLPTIKWVDDSNQEIKTGPGYTLSHKNRVLTVHNVLGDIDRKYYCQGSIPGTGSTPKVEILMNVTSTPVFVKAPQTVIRAVNSDAVFNCDAKSASRELPPNPPEWYINGKIFTRTFDHTKYILSDNNKKMTIKRLKLQDTLCVQCVVENSLGSIMGDACLVVIEPIEIIVKPPAVQEIKKGDTIWLTFKAKHDPSISGLLEKYYFSNVTYDTITQVPFVQEDPNNGTYYIDTGELTMDEFKTVGGVYTCRFSHIDSVPVFVSTEVKLKGIPVPAAATASAGIDMWIIVLIVGIILAIIVVIIVLFVICRKRLEGDYNVDKKETGAGLDPEKELRDKGFNDLSRPEYDDYDFPEKKPRGDLEFDDGPIGDDESLGEYGDEEDTHFNEDGSFIGIYQKKENERQNHKTESTI